MLLETGTGPGGRHPRRGNARGRATREQIILTAERLFADRGLHAVSVREISTAAGQRNNAAVDYHFGSRGDLITAVYVYRAEGVNRRCAQLLEALGASGEPDSAAALLRVQLIPHVESLSDPTNHFVRFLARAFTETNRLEVTSPAASRILLTAVIEAQDRLRRCVPDLDDGQFRRRAEIVANWSIQRLAEFARDHPDADVAAVGLMLDELVDMLEGALRAPLPH